MALVCIAGMAIAACGGDPENANPGQFTSNDTTATPTRTDDVAGASTSQPSGSPTAEPTETGTYTVVPGDTLWAIAQQFNTTIDALVAANNLTDPSAIQIGQVLTIPQTP